MYKTKAIKQIIGSNSRLIDAEVKAFTRSLQKIYAKVINKQTRGIDRKNYLEKMGGLIQATREMGLEDELKNLKGTYYKQYLEAVKLQKESMLMANKEPVVSLSKEEVTQLINMRVNTIGENVLAQSQRLQDIVTNQVLVGQIDNDVLDELADDMGASPTALLRTGLSTFYRTVNASMAQRAGFNLMWYVGPEDDDNRPFCAEILERDPAIYTIDEITSMDNGQGLDVLSSGGGWNCRHIWMGVSYEQAIEMGYEPDGD